MAFTLAQVEALEKAIAAGVRRVRFADREVEYQSLDDMREALAMMNRALSPTYRSTRYAAHDKMGPDESE